MRDSPRPSRRASSAPRRPPGTVSLERALSKLGIASRSEARALILCGRVTVGGRLATDPREAVVPERAAIAIDRRPVGARAPTVVVALNKPKGVVTTRRDPEGRPTVHELVRGAVPRVDAVGRLDLATTGLLLMTNDTQLAAALTDPSIGLVRRYLVTVRGAVDDARLKSLERGIVDRGELLQAARADATKRSHRETHVVVELQEGRNREIRRMFAALGHDVTRLKRVAFGPIELGDLPSGRWRALKPEEVKLLAAAAGRGQVARGGRTGRSAPLHARNAKRRAPDA